MLKLSPFSFFAGLWEGREDVKFSAIYVTLLYIYDTLKENSFVITR